MWQRLKSAAFAPVDIAALVFFRVAFGVILTWEATRYLRYGWIADYWIKPQFHFTYYGFDWVKPFPPAGMYAVWWAIGISAGCIALGLLYRVATLLFFTAFTYCFLLDETTYLNHFYFVCLLSFLLVFVPAHRALSIDAWLRPKVRSDTVAAWTIWVLRVQVAVVYFFAGVAKLSADWLRAEPMRTWLGERPDFPLLGPLFRTEWFVHAMSYGGLLFDLSIAPLLFWKRTRLLGFCLAVTFHLINARLFAIGIFPWLGIAATTLFFPPDWPRRFLARVDRRNQPAPTAAINENSATLTLVIAFVVVQLLVPLRHLLYPGNVDWTYEGHRFSWRMKLLDRNAGARFTVSDPNTGTLTEVNPRTYLNRMQARKMAARPDMILQFAHFLARTWPRSGDQPVHVYARVMASLNGRKPAPLVDSSLDLAAQPRDLRHATWLLPLKEPLPPPGTHHELRTDSDS